MCAARRDRRWVEPLKDMLNVHSGERRGMLVLIGVLLLMGAGAVYEQWFRTPDRPKLDHLQASLEAWVAEGTKPLEAKTYVRFRFDPNSIGRTEWMALGLTDKQVDGIERYMAKGGQFRTKRDVAKMYSIPPELFSELEPYIDLPDSLVKRGYRKWEGRKRASNGTDTIRRTATYSPRVQRSVELNSADTLELTAVYGIGPAFARAMVKYRDALGGYVSMDQLEEVYILKDKQDAIDRFSEHLVLDTLLVRRIPINTCTVEDLAAHPYLRWRLAKPLIAYRNQHGPFKTTHDITGCILIDEALFRKLAPYLTVE